MADNATPPFQGTGDTTPKIAADEATYSGDTAKIQLVRLVGVSGSEGSKSIQEPPVDATYGHAMDIKRVPTDPFGANADAASGTGSISAKLRRLAQSIYDEDSAHTSADPGTAVWAVRRDAEAISSGTDGDYSTLNVDGKTGRLHVNLSSFNKISATPTLSTSIYASGDQFGTVMTFTGAAIANGGIGRVVNAVITNRDTDSPLLELWLYRVSPTMVNADNGVFDLTDANQETGELIGVIDFVTWYNTSAGQVCIGQFRGTPLGAMPLPYVCGSGATSIYGIMCVRATPTQASTTDVVVTLTLQRE